MHPDPVPAPEQAGNREGAKIERAYQQLRHDIMSGTYSSNERLVEAPLTRALGISRNTLRTVLARLEQEKLVVLEPNRGGRVRAFSLDEARDMFRVREVVEGLVARLAAERATPGQLDELRSVVAQTGQAVQADDVMRATRTNRSFHETLISVAGSPQAATTLEALNFPLVKFQFQVSLMPGRKQDNLEEHRRLLMAVEAHDADLAERLARDHIQQIRFTLERLGSLAPVTAVL
jgi:DNA-binding GntR family transcriptional regulator